MTQQTVATPIEEASLTFKQSLDITAFLFEQAADNLGADLDDDVDMKSIISEGVCLDNYLLRTLSIGDSILVDTDRLDGVDDGMNEDYDEDGDDEDDDGDDEDGGYIVMTVTIREEGLYLTDAEETWIYGPLGSEFTAETYPLFEE